MKRIRFRWLGRPLGRGVALILAACLLVSASVALYYTLQVRIGWREYVWTPGKSRVIVESAPVNNVMFRWEAHSHGVRSSGGRDWFWFPEVEVKRLGISFWSSASARLGPVVSVTIRPWLVYTASPLAMAMAMLLLLATWQSRSLHRQRPPELPATAPGGRDLTSVTQMRHSQ